MAQRNTPQPAPAIHRLRRAAGVWLAVIAPAALALGAALGPSTAHAEKKPKSAHVKPAVDIMAEGKVFHAGAPVEGAVVYLENPKSLTIKSYLTLADGSYHFSNLAPQTDYEVWAEQNGIQSKHKFISQFSSHTKFVFTLKLEPEHKRKILGIF